jgi:vanillate O-demethylase monooxygenase subunit
MTDEFIRNGWYAAAWSEEVGRTLLERWICGVPIVLYRKEDGDVAALYGTCPHRAYPLALGRLKGDELECGYHGITFDGEGRCVRIPGEQRPQKAMKVRSYPLVERGGLIWIWPGEPSLADPSQIAERWLADRNWTSVHGTKVFECRASLLIENLLDLSHETFLHAGSIGEHAVAETPIVTETFDDHVSATRVIMNVAPAPLFQKAGISGNIDRGQIAEFWVPGLCLTKGSATPRTSGQPTVRWTVIHCVTPETANRTRYLWAVARDYALGDEDVSETWRRGSDSVFQQDVDALNAQEKRLACLPPDHVELSIVGDAAALASRKMIRARLRTEREEAAPSGV